MLYGNSGPVLSVLFIRCLEVGNWRVVHVVGPMVCVRCLADVYRVASLFWMHWLYCLILPRNGEPRSNTCGI